MYWLYQILPNYLLFKYRVKIFYNIINNLSILNINNKNNFPF